MTMAIYVPSVAICVPPIPYIPLRRWPRGHPRASRGLAASGWPPSQLRPTPPTPLPLQGSHPRA
jgi:hypothetical protein